MTEVVTAGPTNPSSPPGSPSASNDGQANQIRCDSPSIDDLMDAYWSPRRAGFLALKTQFEDAEGLTIREQYFTSKARGIALLVLVREYGVLEVVTAYDCRCATPDFDEIMRDLQSERLNTSMLLKGRARDIAIQRIFAVVANLLNVLDAYVSADETQSDDNKYRIERAIQSARIELNSIHRFVNQSVRRVALRCYLRGFPLGFLVACGLVLLIAFVPFQIGSDGRGNDELAISLGAGAVGAVVSVMSRLTRGQVIDIDTDQSWRIVMLAGSFRPIIGAVLAAAIYSLIMGGILPLSPQIGAGADLGFFYASIAFLAGFSERWAQDTIVRSAPRIGMQMTPLTPQSSHLDQVATTSRR